jgi:AcrR family transcriptional regulator
MTDAEGSAERILHAATVLFAEHGYDGVSTREIAAAAGLNIATVHYHAGTKRELYQAVFRRLYEAEYATIAAALDQVDDALVADPEALRAFLEGFVDILLDMTLSRPEAPRLWVRRWLEEPDDDDDIEVTYALPIFVAVHDLLDRAQRTGLIRTGGLDPRLFLKSFTWMLYGYVLSGPLDWKLGRADPLDPSHIEAFKGFLNDYVARMLELPPYRTAQGLGPHG